MINRQIYAANNRENESDYDIEVYEEDAFVVFKEPRRNDIHNLPQRVHRITRLIHTSTLVGYNNYYYDDIVISAMMDCWTPKQLKRLMMIYCQTREEISIEAHSLT